jgi:DNA-binding SARP family transcriptional activator
MALRIYLTGTVCVESAERVWDESWFSSRQARLLFVYLVCERTRPVPTWELAEVLWPDATPPAWEAGLRALLSKLRQFLSRLDMSTFRPSISNQFGCYQIHLPPGTWVDLEVARHSIDEAEGALRSGNPRSAGGPTNVALVIGRRQFLPGGDGDWVEGKRRELRALLVRAMDCYAEIGLTTGEANLTVQMAGEAVMLEPFRERGYQQLMQAHARLGNRAEALQVYHHCRELLSRELGINPSPETEALYLEILRLS